MCILRIAMAPAMHSFAFVPLGLWSGTHRLHDGYRGRHGPWRQITGEDSRGHKIGDVFLRACVTVFLFQSLNRLERGAIKHGKSYHNDSQPERRMGQRWIPGPFISVSGNAISVDMSAYNRPFAAGTVLDSSNIKVTFGDDNTYTAKLVADAMRRPTKFYGRMVPVGRGLQSPSQLWLISMATG